MLCTARTAFNSGKTLPYSFRLNQLKNLNRMMIECQEEICKALALDLRKSTPESNCLHANIHVRIRMIGFNTRNFVHAHEARVHNPVELGGS